MKNGETSTNLKPALWVLLTALVVSWALFMVGLALIAGYNDPDAHVTYTTPLGLGVLRRLLSLATLGEIVRPLRWPHWLFMALSPLSAALAVHAARTTRTKLLFGALVSQFLLLWPGWFGLYVLPFELWNWLSHSVDGEWLGEQWPITEALGIWLGGCVVVTLLLSRTRRALRGA
jgi:hypothetical protein